MSQHETVRCPLCAAFMDTLAHEPVCCQGCGQTVCRACCLRVRDWLDTAGATLLLCVRCQQEAYD
jgi:hypothetical protein